MVDSSGNEIDCAKIDGKKFSTALQFLVCQQRRIAQERKKEEEFKKQQNYGYKFKITLFTIIASGAGMLGAFLIHDALKDTLYKSLEKAIVGDKCLSLVPDAAGYLNPNAVPDATPIQSASCTRRTIFVRILYILLALAIVVPIVIAVSLGKTNAENEERSRVETLMERRKLMEEGR